MDTLMDLAGDFSMTGEYTSLSLADKSIHNMLYRVLVGNCSPQKAAEYIGGFSGIAMLPTGQLIKGEQQTGTLKEPQS